MTDDKKKDDTDYSEVAEAEGARDPNPKETYNQEDDGADRSTHGKHLKIITILRDKIIQSIFYTNLKILHLQTSMEETW